MSKVKKPKNVARLSQHKRLAMGCDAEVRAAQGGKRKK